MNGIYEALKAIGEDTSIEWEHMYNISFSVVPFITWYVIFMNWFDNYGRANTRCVYGNADREMCENVAYVLEEWSK